MEGGLKQGGLLEKTLALLSGVEPVGSGTRQVEDASPPMEGAVEQVQDGPGVVGDVDLPHTGWDVQTLSSQAVSALIDSQITIDRRGGDVAHAGQGDLPGLLSPGLPVEDIVPVPAGAFWRSKVQGVEASDVVLWRRGRNLNLPREGCEYSASEQGDGTTYLLCLLRKLR